MGLYKPPLMLYKDRTAKNSDRVKAKFLQMWSHGFFFLLFLTQNWKLTLCLRVVRQVLDLKMAAVLLIFWGIEIRHRIWSLTHPYFLYETEKICASWSSSVLIPKMSIAFVFNKSSFTLHTENGVVLHSGVFYRPQ